jgi:DNA-binding transcriptional MerR regulator
MTNVWKLDFAPTDEQLPPMELAHRLGVSESTIRLWSRKGVIPSPQRLGHRTVRYSWNSALARLRARQIA